ncbi:Fc.00g071260.m01.CDS01 [Cosmosporella sp. VM-42]
MGIPYSKQINAAFDEVTPLVAAGFEVLQTSRNISFLLAVIQVLNLLLLSLAVLALVGLLITVNPDLTWERRTLVTPVVKRLAGWVIDRTWLWLLIWPLLVGGVLGGYAGWYITQDSAELIEKVGEGNDEHEVDKIDDR